MYSLTHQTPQKAPNDLTDDELIQANNTVAQLIASTFSYLDHVPTVEIQETWNKDFSPNSENEWIRLLLLNVFDGCGMSYQGCESQVLSRADGQHAKICGQPCVQYFSGSMYEGIGCASPNEYSDTDITNVLQNFLVIEDLNMDDLKTDKTANPDENFEERKRECESLPQRNCENDDSIPTTSEQNKDSGQDILKTTLQGQKSTPSPNTVVASQEEFVKEPQRNYENDGSIPTTSEQNKDSGQDILKTTLQGQKSTPSPNTVVAGQEEFMKECHFENENLQCPLNMQDKNKIHESSGIKVVKIGKGSYPGYAKILKSNEASDLLRIADSLNHGPVIRSTDKENLLAHEFEFDNAIAVECKYWPAAALEWETRERKSGWPGSDLILQCRNVPCAIVSKSHALNPNDRSEWRFSFARQEGILFRSLPMEVRMVYIISKVLLKQAVLKEESLASYHLKTSFLWYCECIKTDEFTKNDLEVNICNFLQFLKKQVENHSIPNYFIEQTNMISHISLDKIENVKIQIEYFLTHLLEEVSSVRTAKQYPYNMAYIARDLRHFPSKRSSCLQKIHSNFLLTIINHLFGKYLPNSHLVWMYCQYIPFLVQRFCSADNYRVTTDVSDRCLATRAHTDLVFKVYGMEWIKLVTLYCCLVEMKAPELRNAARLLLDSSFALQSDHLSTSSCIADMINLIGVELGASATESCCLTVKEWVLRNQTGNDVFMLTLKRMLTTFGTAKDNQECDHLLSCLVVIVNVLGLSKDSVEVGIATSLRLHHSLEHIRVISTLCDLINSVELSSVLKHLIYLTVLFLEEEEKRKSSLKNTETKDDGTKKETTLASATHKELTVDAMHEARKAFKAVQSLLKSGILKTCVDDFRFVSAAVVFQKLTSETPNLKIVRAFLDLVKSTDLSTEYSDLHEIQTDLENLVKTETLDINNAFQFLVFYAWKNIASSGLEFTSSVLDELVQPHFNLGVLSAAGTELIASEKLDESISTLELWLNRSTGAPITQNPILRVKIYGKLGYLYHVKAMEAGKEGLKARLIAKSVVMFSSAIKEKVSDITVIVDYVLFQWERQCHSDVKLYLHRACCVDDIMSISVYFKHSKQLMSNLVEIRKELEIKGQLKVSSIVFAHFIAISYSIWNAESHTGLSDDSSRQDENLEHLLEMQRCIEILDLIHRQMEDEDSDSSDQIDVLADTNMLLGFAANSLGVYEVALNAFKKTLTLDPNNITARERIEELSVS